MKIFCGGRLALNEVFHFFGREKIIAVVNGLVADTDCGHVVLNMIRAALDKNIFAVDKISIDIGGDNLFLAVENDLAEADNDAMNMRHIIRIAVPTESSIGEVDMIARRE